MTALKVTHMNNKTGVKQFLASCALAVLMLAPLPRLALANSAPPEPSENAASGHAAKAETEMVTPAIVEMPALHIVMLKNNQIAGNLVIEMRLDIPSPQSMAQFNANQSRLSANYTATLGKWATTFQDARAPANVIAIKNQLQRVTDMVLGLTDTKVLLLNATVMRKR